ncbi:hypothetical protein I5E68_02120 [Novosphingobium sp. YJ-S2-02]|uniref:Short chain dehydrogenase-like proteobacteria domain-containing protein n=1 Tax=Novosphingobium aureum TaxID=2792964 RepID=A0A931MK87_9SPHN|nr:hypothetical protein [Novosphingobium aureum]MBH0111746.1 hypothetical protein [Novosphingobium aureum]
MPSELLYVGPLADDPLDAAADFHARILPAVEMALSTGAGPLTLVFEPASVEHRGWRLAVVQGLARRFAPTRVNALAAPGADPAQRGAIAATREWLDASPGVTGQLFAVDGTQAPPMV